MAKLDRDDREAILAEAKLVVVESSRYLHRRQAARGLDATPLSAWQDRISLVLAGVSKPDNAAKKLEPESVTVAAPSATIKTADDLQTYLDELRATRSPTSTPARP